MGGTHPQPFEVPCGVTRISENTTSPPPESVNRADHSCVWGVVVVPVTSLQLAGVPDRRAQSRCHPTQLPVPVQSSPPRPSGLSGPSPARVLLGIHLTQSLLAPSPSRTRRQIQHSAPSSPPARWRCCTIATWWGSTLGLGLRPGTWLAAWQEPAVWAWTVGCAVSSSGLTVACAVYTFPHFTRPGTYLDA